MSLLCLSSSVGSGFIGLKEHRCATSKRSQLSHTNGFHLQIKHLGHANRSEFPLYPNHFKTHLRLRRCPRRLVVNCNFQEALADLAPTTSAVYGFLLLSGGLFAYNRSGSKGSLYGGITGAVLMGLAYRLMQAPETKAIGDAVGFGSAFLFSSVFGIRLAATSKLIPAGPLLGLSICSLAVFVFAYIRDGV